MTVDFQEEDCRVERRTITTDVIPRVGDNIRISSRLGIVTKVIIDYDLADIYVTYSVR